MILSINLECRIVRAARYDAALGTRTASIRQLQMLAPHLSMEIGERYRQAYEEWTNTLCAKGKLLAK